MSERKELSNHLGMPNIKLLGDRELLEELYYQICTMHIKLDKLSLALKNDTMRVSNEDDFDIEDSIGGDKEELKKYLKDIFENE